MARGYPSAMSGRLRARTIEIAVAMVVSLAIVIPVGAIVDAHGPYASAWRVWVVMGFSVIIFCLSLMLVTKVSRTLKTRESGDRDSLA